MKKILGALLTAGVLHAGEPMVGVDYREGDFKLVVEGRATPVFVDAADMKVVHIAVGDFAHDVELVTGLKPRILHDVKDLPSEVVLIGTLGHSAAIDSLVQAKKIDVTQVAGQWETFLIQVVADPLPNVKSALVIAGSDRRGTAFGVYEMSEQIGVSPWGWWADVPPRKQGSLVVRAGTYRQGPPSVKYRGIFINDEDWGLLPWASTTFDPAQGNIGPKTYRKVFELLLRLKGNHIWPAMKRGTTEFGSIPGNVTLADEYAIAVGASHCEPMLRNNGYWPATNGLWRYDTNRERVFGYWEEGAQRHGKYESVWTLGIRGIHDTSMKGPPDTPSRVKLVEKVFADQRDLLRKYVNPDLDKVAQCFVPYKEVMELYQAGLNVPDDVTLIWVDDNFGYIRQLSNPQERARRGGAGVYYHLAYLGAPKPYLWLNSTPPALVWEEMTKAYAYGAQRIWVANVGDIKPCEIGIDFWMRLAWNVNAYGPDVQMNFLKDFAGRVFGAEHAAEVAGILDEYYRLSVIRRPEHLNSAHFSATYGENERVRQRYGQVLARAEAVELKLAPELKDAYFQLVLYPVRILSLVGQACIAADEAGKNESGTHAGRVKELVARIRAETDRYNHQIAGGKWKGMIMVLGRTSKDWLGDGTPLLQNGRCTGDAKAKAEGFIAITAANFTRSISRHGAAWQAIPGLGRTGSAITVLPFEQPSRVGDFSSESPAVEYAFTNKTASKPATVHFQCLPTQRIHQNRSMRFAVAVDDGVPQVLDYQENGGANGQSGEEWGIRVLANVASVSCKVNVSAGDHTLQVWMVDPGVVLDKIIIDLGGLQPTYLGPPAMERR
jgi:hypothetical protein